ncbi:hypothetical protein C0993_003800, partial [Termitomyces sp. T159_Od127]
TAAHQEGHASDGTAGAGAGEKRGLDETGEEVEAPVRKRRKVVAILPPKKSERTRRDASSSHPRRQTLTNQIYLVFAYVSSQPPSSLQLIQFSIPLAQRLRLQRAAHKASQGKLWRPLGAIIMVPMMGMSIKSRWGDSGHREEGVEVEVEAEAEVEVEAEDVQNPVRQLL